jgi:hypothetical protein
MLILWVLYDRFMAKTPKVFMTEKEIEYYLDNVWLPKRD